MRASKAHRLLAAVVLAVTTGLVACSDGQLQTSEARLIEARDIKGEFARQLKAELSSAMQAGGPVQAITVCRDRAPQIAASLSAASGAKVSRTALRVRNPDNQPLPWQSAVMVDFEHRLAAGEAPGQVEFFAAENRQLRYMSAIPTGGLCLACHGEQLAPDVRTALQKLYPEDQATGFAAGELRGAFSIVWNP